MCGIHNTKGMQQQHIWKHSSLSSIIHFCHLSIWIFICHRIQQTKQQKGATNKQHALKQRTCSIFSNKQLHISSQRLRTEASDTGLIPKALADSGKKIKG
nr:hypothetical protein Itr_chr10CG19610 [Ipomoea trifida]